MGKQTLTLTLALAIIIGSTTLATAQTYRWTDPASGKMVISSEPPPPGVQAAKSRGASSADPGTEMPVALRQAIRDFPVQLYTGENCTPCPAARNLLAARGIPFTEKTVTSESGVEELKRVSGSASIPTLLVGRQAQVGFLEAEWQSLLDLAGYPKSLPLGYRPAKPAEAQDKPPAATDTPPGAANGSGR